MIGVSSLLFVTIVSKLIPIKIFFFLNKGNGRVRKKNKKCSSNLKKFQCETKECFFFFLPLFFEAHLCVCTNPLEFMDMIVVDGL